MPILWLLFDLQKIDNGWDPKMIRDCLIYFIRVLKKRITHCVKNWLHQKPLRWLKILTPNTFSKISKKLITLSKVNVVFDKMILDESIFNEVIKSHFWQSVIRWSYPPLLKNPISASCFVFHFVQLEWRYLLKHQSVLKNKKLSFQNF
jgi:hypothetical protein